MTFRKHIVQLIALLCCLSLSGLAQEPQMTTEERAKLIKWLKDSQAETIAAVEKCGTEKCRL
jgi:hypothetical protein